MRPDLKWIFCYVNGSIISFIEFATVTGDETGLTSQLISTLSTPLLLTHPLIGGCTTPPGSTPPTLYERQCGFFHVPQESEQRKSC